MVRIVFIAKILRLYTKLGDLGFRKDEFPFGTPGPKHMCRNLRFSVSVSESFSCSWKTTGKSYLEA